MEEPEYSDRLRTIDIFSLMAPRPLWRLMRGIVRAPFEEDFVGSPLAVCWFVTLACNAHCLFCCKSKEVRLGRNEFPPLPVPQAAQLMGRIRQSVDLLYLSGGEPLMHPHLLDILTVARQLEFASVGMSTNLILLDRNPGVIDLLDAVSVSIHSPDPARHALNLGVSRKIAERVFQNLELIRSHPRRRQLKVIVNCVMNEENLDTVLDMVEFTRKLGFLLELVPANEHGRLPSLAGNLRYIALIDDILKLRRSGGAPHLAGSTAYYERIRSFEPFRCFPYGVPNVMPDGRLCTPCDVSEQYHLNVLDYPTLKAAVKASRGHFGNYPCAAGYCFKAGIIERSRLFGLLLSGRNKD
jgi:MoaA/NifB/PqqE/SkfB family radical SAM enzyme